MLHTINIFLVDWLVNWIYSKYIRKVWQIVFTINVLKVFIPTIIFSTTSFLVFTPLPLFVYVCVCAFFYVKGYNTIPSVTKAQVCYLTWAALQAVSDVTSTCGVQEGSRRTWCWHRRAVVAVVASVAHISIGLTYRCWLFWSKTAVETWKID